MMKRHFLISVLCFSVLLVAEPPAYLFYPFDNAQGDIAFPSNRQPAEEMDIVSPRNGECVPLLSNQQKAYLDIMPREARVAYFANAAKRPYIDSPLKDEWTVFLPSIPKAPMS